MLKFPLITAHSGCEDSIPNSMESVLEGLNSGADIIEIDVRATSDGVAILSHDEAIAIPGFRIKRITYLSYDELKRICPRIQRLDAVLEIIRSRSRLLNLDLKDDLAVAPAIETLKSAGMKDFAVFSGCNHERAAFINDNYKGFRILFNTEEESLPECQKPDYLHFTRKTYENAIKSGCCGINISYEACLPELIDFMAPRCFPVCVYTIDDAGLMEKFIRMGAYSITTNKVSLLDDLKKMNTSDL